MDVCLPHVQTVSTSPMSKLIKVTINNFFIFKVRYQYRKMWWRSDQTDEMESASSELAKISPSSALRYQKWIGLGSSPLQVFMPLQSDSKSVCIALSNTIQGNFTLFENEQLSAKAEIVGQMLKNLVFR